MGSVRSEFGSSFFPASSHAARLEEIGEEIDQARVAMKLLCGASPDDPIRRAGNMLAAISTAHFDEAARLRCEKPARVQGNASVKRRQQLILGAMASLVLVLALIWLFPGDDHYHERLATVVTEDDFVRRPASEQEWIARTENRFEEVHAR